MAPESRTARSRRRSLATPDTEEALSTERSTRDHVTLAINGQVHEVRGEHARWTLSRYVREYLRLTGTKVVCAEGDCGACTVLVGELNEAGGFDYRTIDSCIAFVFQLDRRHVVTVDGLGKATTREALHPVQRVFAEHYGSQCGFCTPGFVMSLVGIAAAQSDPHQKLTPDVVAPQLSGNLCRCTGYVQILEAAEAIDLDSLPPLRETFDDEELAKQFTGISESACIDELGGQIAIASTLEEALALRTERPDAIVVAGATDLGVQSNKGRLRKRHSFLALSPSIDELSTLDVGETHARVGALVRWSDFEELVTTRLPAATEILERFGAPQIRNAGTIGGNIINASPIADSLPLLYACDAVLHVASARGQRDVAIADFYQGYKTLDLEADELLVGVTFELPTKDELALVKVSRRRDLDISTFTAAAWLGEDAEGRLAGVRLAYGGVGPTVLRLPKTEGLLEGERPSLALFRAAGDCAGEEISPISDVRGSASYRSQLARNAMLHFYAELQTPSSAPAA